MKYYSAILKQYPPLSAKELSSLCKKYKKTKSTLIKDKLINHNLRLVLSVAKRYKYSNVEIEDIISEGTLGLMIAVEKFEPSKGFKFSTYAIPWIQSKIRYFVNNTKDSITLPPIVAKMRKDCQELKDEGKTNLQINEILKVDTSSSHMNYSYNTVSLNSTFNGVETSELINNIPYEEDVTWEDRLELKMMCEFVRKNCSGLSLNESYVVLSRLTGVRKTLTRLGAEVGLSRERVRQLEKRAVHVIKQNIHGNANYLSEEKLGVLAPSFSL